MATKTTKTITLLGWDSKRYARKLHPKAHHIEFGNLLVKDENGKVVQTISLTRYQIGMTATCALCASNPNIHRVQNKALV